MEYYIGIDGGGTNSRLLAVDQNENPIYRGNGASTNLASNTKVFVTKTLETLFSEFFTQSSMVVKDCLGVCIGSAGLDTDEACRQMEDMIRDIGFACPVLAVNDSLLVLAAATGGKPGVVVISGTGSIAYGMDKQGKPLRVGGWGHIFDDGGSGYWIGKEALKYAFFSYDGRGEKTMLENAVKKHFSVDDITHCIAKIHGDAFGKAKIAQLGILVEEGAKQGDRVCNQILDEAANELFMLAITTLKGMGESQLNVIVSGGNIVNNFILFDKFKERMKKAHPGARVIKIGKDPVLGAVYLATRQSKA